MLPTVQDLPNHIMAHIAKLGKFCFLSVQAQSVYFRLGHCLVRGSGSELMFHVRGNPPQPVDLCSLAPTWFQDIVECEVARKSMSRDCAQALLRVWRDRGDVTAWNIVQRDTDITCMVSYLFIESVRKAHEQTPESYGYLLKTAI